MNKLFSGARDNTIRVWDADMHAHVATLTYMKVHIDYVFCLTIYKNKLFSSSVNSILFSGRFDNTIRVWDANTHAHVATLQGHTDEVYCLTIYKNKLFSGSNDSTIRVWNLDE